MGRVSTPEDRLDRSIEELQDFVERLEELKVDLGDARRRRGEVRRDLGHLSDRALQLRQLATARCPNSAPRSPRTALATTQTSLQIGYPVKQSDTVFLQAQERPTPANSEWVHG